MSFARALSIVSGLTVISRISGFVRDTLTAMYLGADPIADAYFAAQRLPNLFRSLFAEGAFSASFVPLYTSEKNKHGYAAAQHFAGQALAILLATLIPFSLIIMTCMPLVIRYILAPGFADDPAQFNIAIKFSLITFPYLILISITALQGGVLNAQSKFAAAAAAPISLNVVMVIALIVAHYCGWHIGYTLSWAFLLSGVVQMSWLAISCYRARATIPLSRPRLNNETLKFFQRIGPGAIGAGAMQINMLLSTNFASSLPGAVSYLNYADRLNQLPLGIIGIAVATTLLPLLSRHIEAGAEDSARHYISRAIEFCALLGLPAAIGFVLLAEPIVQTLFEHGAFGREDALKTAQALAAYALGIPAFLLVKVFTASFYARHNTALPVKLSLITMAINVGGAYILMHPLQHIGIALANGIAMWADVVLLLICMGRMKIKFSDDKLRYRLPRLMFCSACMGVVTYTLYHLLIHWFTKPHLLVEIAGLMLIIGGSGLIYGLLVHFTHAMRLDDALRMLRRRGNKEGLAKSGPSLTGQS